MTSVHREWSEAVATRHRLACSSACTASTLRSHSTARGSCSLANDSPIRRATLARAAAPRWVRFSTAASASTAASGSKRARRSRPCARTVSTFDGSPSSLIVPTRRGLLWTVRHAAARRRSPDSRNRSRYRARRTPPRAIASSVRSQAAAGENRSDSSQTANTGSHAFGRDLPDIHSASASDRAPASSPVASNARAWWHCSSIEAFSGYHSMNLRHSRRSARRSSHVLRSRNVTGSPSWRPRNDSTSGRATRGQAARRRASST